MQVNFRDRKSAKKCLVLADLSFRHASYLIQDVRKAEIRLVELVYLPCLRKHVLRAYYTFASKQAVSITLFGPRPNNKPYLQLYRIDIFLEIHLVYFSFKFDVFFMNTPRCLFNWVTHNGVIRFSEL